MKNTKFKLEILFLLLALALPAVGLSQQRNCDRKYDSLQRSLARGWNTWNTRSVLSHVLLPSGFSLSLQLTGSRTGDTLKEALIGRRDKGAETVSPGLHPYNGAYTGLKLVWKGISIQVESATEGGFLYLLVSPLSAEPSAQLIVKPGFLWGLKGAAMPFYVMAGANEKETCIKTVSQNLAQAIFITTNPNTSPELIKALIKKQSLAAEASHTAFANLGEVHKAMQTVLGWDMIYEPETKRVLTPVSRIWNSNSFWQGWVLFDWDAYFASWMISSDNRDLALANAVAITEDVTAGGFVPNFSSHAGKSEDRSEPPVGAFTVGEIYKKYPERWFLERTFDHLLSWNRWWDTHRQLDGYLVWGSDPFKPSPGFPAWLNEPVNTKQGAKYESGLDNSPMYDEALYDTTRHKLLLADVGLLSLYILDCQSLQKIALTLGKTQVAEELKHRESKYTQSLKKLWNEQAGIYMNRDLSSGKWSPHLSPTLFYPLLCKVPDARQATRMVREHLENPAEFQGPYTIPAIARNDPAFKDNNYWRGRIWAPMNFLVYLGLKNYRLDAARKDLVTKSRELLLKSWLGEGHVYENYNALNGKGDDVSNSDKFYHWGALNGFISIMESRPE